MNDNLETDLPDYMPDEGLPVSPNLIIGTEDFPKLVLPPAMEVRPPKYVYELQYEVERKEWIKKNKRGDSSWKAEQRKRWVSGHAGLVGSHYFYLTQIKIKNANGELIRPIWRDVDEDIFREFEDCLLNERDLVVFKRREVGLSSVFGGALPLWTMVLHPGSVCLMTSADLPRVKDLMSNKLIAQHGALEDWIKPNRKTYDPQKGATFQELDEDGKETGNVAEVICRQTSQDKKDVTNLEGPRAKIAFLDEFFLHPWPEDVRQSVESCLMDGQSRVGIMIAGGSAGSVSRMGLKQAREIINKAATGIVRLLFLSGSKGITKATIRNERGDKIGVENFCINGWSDVPRAEAFIRYQRAIYDLSPNKKDLISFTKRYPLSLEEVLSSDEFGVIPKDIAERIPTQELELETRPRNIRRCFIEEVNGKFVFKNDPYGPWVITEEPVAGEEYHAGTDAIPMLAKSSESTIDPEGTDRSMHCTVIRRRGTRSYAAIYLRRTSDIDLIYSDVIAGQKAFNHCQNMIERNSAQLLYDRYSQNGTLNYLAYQPVAYGSKGYKKGTLRGIYKDANNTERIYNAGFDYFREDMQNVDFPIILSQLRVFGQENTDVIDAIMMCEVFVKTLEITDGKKAMEAMKKKFRDVPHVEYIGLKRLVRYTRQEIDANGNPIESHGGMTPLTNLR